MSLGNPPDIIGIGGQRCGSTSLFRYMTGSPDIHANDKEIHFFDRYKEKGWDWYFNHFDDDHLSIDFTPGYSILNRREVREVRKYCPKAKIICTLRNPVHRVISVVKAETRWNPILRSRFEDPQKVMKAVERHARNRRSHYKRIIDCWSESYEEQFHLYYFDDMIRDPEQFGETICKDMEVRSPTGSFVWANRSPQLELGFSACRWLVDYFEPTIKRWRDVIECRIIDTWLEEIEDLRGRITP